MDRACIFFITSGVGLSPLYCGYFWPIVPLTGKSELNFVTANLWKAVTLKTEKVMQELY
jgi:hypothetical protein